MNNNEEYKLDEEILKQQNNNQEQMIYCTKCGQPMKITARYCMHCIKIS